MIKRWPFLIPLAVLIVLVAVFSKRLVDVDGGIDPSFIPSVLLDREVPEFALAPLPGRGKALATQDLSGGISLINIWGSWCVACLAEHPLLMELARQNTIPIHGIAWRDNPQAALAWLSRHGDPYERIGLDPDSQTAIAFGVTGAPETFIVDSEGMIRYKHIGPISADAWSNTIEPLIRSLEQ